MPKQNLQQKRDRKYHELKYKSDKLLPKIKNGGREYKKQSIKNDELECPICLSIITDLITTKCNHHFCNNCLNKSLENKPDCPLCRTNLSLLVPNCAKFIHIPTTYTVERHMTIPREVMLNTTNIEFEFMNNPRITYTSPHIDFRISPSININNLILSYTISYSVNQYN
jgi:hypothetical protein